MSKVYYVCPHCHKSVKDLKSHIARLHPDQVDNKTQPEKTKPTTKGKQLEIEKPETKTKEKESAGAYHCLGCGATVSKGQNPCPSCGQALDWSQV